MTTNLLVPGSGKSWRHGDVYSKPRLLPFTDKRDVDAARGLI